MSTSREPNPPDSLQTCPSCRQQYPADGAIRPDTVRSAMRLYDRPSNRNFTFGFRPARTVTNDGPAPPPQPAP